MEEKASEILASLEMSSGDDGVLSALWDDTEDRRRTSALHEAGHAVFAWLLSRRDPVDPPFQMVSIEAAPNCFGVVPGTTSVAPTLLSRLGKPQHAALLLAGWYVQEGHRMVPHLADRELRDVLEEKLNDNSDCSSDIKLAIELAPLEGEPTFWAAVGKTLSTNFTEIACEVVRQLATAIIERGCLEFDDVVPILVRVGGP